MSFSLNTVYPFWLSVFCLILGAGYAFILYYRNRNNGFSLPLARILAAIRGVTIFLISFLLLSPMLKSVIRKTEKPVIILALDQSASIVSGKDSSFYRHEFLNDFRELSDKLSDRFDVSLYSISGSLSPGWKRDFSGKETDLGRLFNEVGNRYSNRNLGAVILASDGIITKGTDPVYEIEKSSYPVYTVALGDTNRKRDLLITKVNFNQVAYLGNDFPLEINIAANLCSGTSTVLQVFAENREVYNRQIRIQADDFNLKVPLILTASAPGLQTVRVRLTAVDKEITLANNVQDLYIEVLDSRQRVLLLAAAPHPDIAALRAAIENNRNYQLEMKFQQDFDGNPDDYDLVVFHQVPSGMDAGASVFTKLKANNVPILFLLGSQSNIQAFNALQAGLNIPQSTSSLSSAYPLLNRSFHLFSVDQELQERLSGFPPLNVPFGQYKASTITSPLLYQKIGSVETTTPLITFNSGLDRKIGIITGEGLWRWRMSDFLIAGNHRAFDELIGKIVQYLAVRSDKSQFRVKAKAYYSESETVELGAELYNESFELINEPDINITISDKQGRNFPYLFTRSINAYELVAGRFQPGEYNFRASVTYGGKNLSKNGKFIVTAINDEFINTVADHTLLNTLAKRHNGEMVYPGNLMKIAELLNRKEEIKTIAYSQKRYRDLVSLPLLLVLILTLLSLEWFLRKRNGSY